MKHFLTRFTSLVFAGSLYALAYPSFIGEGYLICVFLALPFFLFNLKGSSKLGTSLFYVLAFNLGLNLTGYYWIPHTLREFGQLDFISSYLLGMGFAIILQPHWWIYVLVKTYLNKIPLHKNHSILIQAFVLTILEIFIPQQFPSYVGSPWLHIAPYLGLAPIFGMSIFSFFTYWISLEIIRFFETKRINSYAVAWFTLFILFNLGFPLKKNQSSTHHLHARIVQANIGNFLKIQSEFGDFNSFEAVERKYKKLSQIKNGFKPDIIVWPETAYPHTMNPEYEFTPDLFYEIIQQTGSDLVIGGYLQNSSERTSSFHESVYNSSLHINSRGLKSFYHKNILIPFGETLPFGSFNKNIINMIPSISLFAKGEGTPLMETSKGFRFVTPICYEILKTGFIRNLLNQWKKNHFIINHTNDSWYGETSEPEQHLFLSKWRAIEFNIPIIRSTNTGISSVIFSDASESQRLNLGEENILDVKIPIEKLRKPTLYQQFGIWNFVILFLTIYGLSFILVKIKKMS